MSLVVLCGHPCSGKSTFAEKLAKLLKDKGREVAIVSEESLHLKRNASYKDVPSEKNTRGLLRSTIDRYLARSRIVIFDSLNFVKGYRYELYCIARSSGARYCMVHIDTPVETCREWNSARTGDKYSPELFEDLAGRFERPDARNRWDSPLYTVKPLEGDFQSDERAEAIVIASTGGAAEATAAAVAVGASAAAPVGKELKPVLATMGSALSSTNLLHDLDKAAQDIIDRISDASAAAAGGAPGIIKFDEDLPQLNICRPMPLPELRRHKRAFMKLATNNTFLRVKDVNLARKMFIDYLKDQI